MAVENIEGKSYTFLKELYNCVGEDTTADCEVAYLAEKLSLKGMDLPNVLNYLREKRLIHQRGAEVVAITIEGIEVAKSL